MLGLFNSILYNNIARGGGYCSLASSSCSVQKIEGRHDTFSKRIVLLCLLILFVLLPLSASNIEWTWSAESSETNYFRYQLNGEDENSWTVVDSQVTSVILPSETDNDTLFVQASNDGKVWSDSSIGTYKRDKERFTNDFSLRLNATPYASALFYFYNGHNIDEARTLMGTVYGLSTSLEADWTINNRFRVYPEIGYSLVVKIQTVIPKETNVHYVKFGGGADVLCNVSPGTNLFAGLLGGGMFHINSNMANFTPYFGVRLGLEKNLGDNFSLGAFSRVTCAFLNADDPLYRSMTMLIDPASVVLTYIF